MKFTDFKTIKLATPPGTGVNPPTGNIFVWKTLDESDNLVINYRLSDGTDKVLAISGIAEFTGTFTSADSTGFAWTDNNTLAVTHNLGKQYVDVLIYDNNGVKVDYTITATSTSVATISFPIAAVPITGTWNIRIR